MRNLTSVQFVGKTSQSVETGDVIHRSTSNHRYVLQLYCLLCVKSSNECGNWGCNTLIDTQIFSVEKCEKQCKSSHIFPKKRRRTNSVFGYVHVGGHLLLVGIYYM